MATLRQLVEQKIIDSDLGFKEVSGAADLSAIVENRLSIPGCYIFRTKANPGENELINAVSQQVNDTIALVVVTNNVRYLRGDDSSDENEVLCEKIQGVLLNFRPAEKYAPMVYSGGTLITFKDGLFVWQETYTTWGLISNNLIED